MAKPTAVIILNWQSYEHTERCVRSVLASTYASCLPIIVDNASADGSYQRLAEAFPDVEMIRTGRNLGYAGGNNVGIRRALELGAEYVFVVNNDTEIPPETIDRLVTVLESDPRIGQLGPKVLDVPTGRIGCLGGEIDWSLAEPRQIACGELDRGQYTETVEVDFVPGTAVLVRAAALAEVGLLPEEYFLYFEDVAWSLRFRAAGWKTLATPGATVRHWESSSVGRESPRKLYYIARNNAAFLDEWVPEPGRDRVRRRFRLKLLKLMVRSLLRGGIPQIRAMILGYRDSRAGRMWQATHAL